MNTSYRLLKASDDFLDSIKMSRTIKVTNKKGDQDIYYNSADFGKAQDELYETINSCANYLIVNKTLDIIEDKLFNQNPPASIEEIKEIIKIGKGE